MSSRDKFPYEQTIKPPKTLTTTLAFLVMPQNSRGEVPPINTTSFQDYSQDEIGDVEIRIIEVKNIFGRSWNRVDKFAKFAIGSQSSVEFKISQQRSIIKKNIYINFPEQRLQTGSLLESTLYSSPSGISLGIAQITMREIGKCEAKIVVFGLTGLEIYQGSTFVVV